MGNRRWNEEEDKLVKSLLSGGWIIDNIAKEVNRTAGAIKNRNHRFWHMKIKKLPQYTEIYRKKIILNRKNHPVKFTEGTYNRRGNPSSKKGKTFENMYGNKKAMEIKEKMSELKRGKHTSRASEFKKGNVPWWIKRNLPHPTNDPEVIEKIRTARLKQKIPKKDTKIEVAVKEELKMRGVDGWTEHFPVRGQPDIAFPKKKVAIFCDGCYWHNCSICGFSNSRSKVNDESINEELERKGWKVLRFWEHEIYQDLNQVVSKITEEIK